MESMYEYWKTTLEAIGAVQMSLDVWTMVVVLMTEIHKFKGYLRCAINMIRRLIDMECVRKRQVKDDS